MRGVAVGVAANVDVRAWCVGVVGLFQLEVCVTGIAEVMESLLAVLIVEVVVVVVVAGVVVAAVVVVGLVLVVVVVVVVDMLEARPVCPFIDFFSVLLPRSVRQLIILILTSLPSIHVTVSSASFRLLQAN